MDATGIAQLNRAAEDLWLAAQPAWPTLSIEVLPESGSTNAHALALGRAGAMDPTLVVAWSQIDGRGRAGRSWQSRAGHSLTMSLALPLDLAAIPGGGALSLAVGVMVAQALNECLTSRQKVRLKWPNDLWIDERKLGGILIEAVASPPLPAQQRWVVIGLGLNLAGSAEDEPAPVRTDLGQWGLRWTPAEALLAVTPNLLAGLRDFASHGLAAFLGAYTQLDALAGRPVSLWRQGWSATQPADIQGTALGVDEHGALLIHDDQGRTTPWAAGEVSVRVQTHPL